MGFVILLQKSDQSIYIYRHVAFFHVIDITKFRPFNWYTSNTLHLMAAE